MPTTDARSHLQPDFDRIERARLARSILDRPQHEVASIAADNPALVREWMSEIRRSRDELEDEARMLSKALTQLLHASADGNRTAA